MKDERIIKTEQNKNCIADDCLEQVSGGNVSDQFKGLPMRELIGGPLEAAAQAQEKLAKHTKEFLDKTGFELK